MKRIRIAWTHKTIKTYYDGHGGWHYDEPQVRELFERRIQISNAEEDTDFRYYIEEEKEETNENH